MVLVSLLTRNGSYTLSSPDGHDTSQYETVLPSPPSALGSLSRGKIIQEFMVTRKCKLYRMQRMNDKVNIYILLNQPKVIRFIYIQHTKDV